MNLRYFHHMGANARAGRLERIVASVHMAGARLRGS
jgi:hypothetical protein